MGFVLELGLLVWVGGLLVPCFVFFAECLIGALARGGTRGGDDGGGAPRVAILVPAHDERGIIARTLSGLRAQLKANDVLLVVADNCSDDTAAIARASGATAIERSDFERRGKGYALVFGLDHLAADPPDVVVIVDADCTVAAGSIDRIARLAARTDRPVQADYVLDAPKDPKGLSVVSALAFVVKNRARPRGLHALGLPCLLTGTGMAFPWRVIRMAPPTEGHLVEDMVMGLDLARLGHAPLLCPDAYVTSELPERAEAAHTQRRRWEHGHLATLLEHGPSLFLQGLTQARFGLVALALDLAVPPLSLLLMLVLATLGFALIVPWLGASWLPAQLAALCVVFMVSGVLSAWLAYGREVVSARQLLAIPRYVLWKLPLYFSFLTRGRHARWERTDRGGNDERAP